jgi:hypothetical protein
MGRMFGPPSVQASSRYERRGGVAGSKNDMAGMLRFWHRLAVAIVAVITCVGITGFGRASACLLVPSIDLAAPGGVELEQAGSRHEPSRSLRDRPRTVVKAVASDLEEEDSQWAMPDDPVSAFQYVPLPRGGDRTFRRELEVDPSRFAAEQGLPRGPPV